MKRYEAYKDSGIEWIGEIPEHWKLKKIKHTTYVKGRIGWQGLRSEEFQEESECYVVTGTDFKNGKVNWKTCYQVTMERYNEDPYIQLRDNDLLITKDGTIGKIALVKNIPKETTLNSGIFVVRPIDNAYITEYMYWILNSNIFTSFYNFNKSGSTIQHLYQNVFNEFQFPCPALSEQQTIANYLERKTSEINSLIVKKKHLISLLQEERTAIINQAVTKGINPNGKLKDSGIEWIGEIPEHWWIVPVRRLIDVRDGTHETPPFINSKGGIPLITSKDFKNGEIVFNNVKLISIEDHLDISKRSGVTKGDVLMSMIGGNIGKSVLVGDNDQFSIKNVALFRTHNSLSMAKFLRYYFESTLLDRQIELKSRGGAQGFLSLGDIRNLIFFKIPEDELKSIVIFLDKKTSQIDNIITETKKEIELLEEYRTSLISDVVTGKLDVKEEVVN
ncbi:MAG: restriction endonuclease subunit S [Bacteroidia bacterium]